MSDELILDKDKLFRAVDTLIDEDIKRREAEWTPKQKQQLTELEYRIGMKQRPKISAEVMREKENKSEWIKQSNVNDIERTIKNGKRI